jgi:DNA-binding XRE family transcriptional regulator
MTQEQLAQLVGVTHSTIARVESGKVQPHRLTKRAIAETLGVDVAALFSPSGNDPRNS